MSYSASADSSFSRTYSGSDVLSPSFVGAKYAPSILPRTRASGPLIMLDFKVSAETN